MSCPERLIQYSTNKSRSQDTPSHPSPQPKHPFHIDACPVFPCLPMASFPGKQSAHLSLSSAPPRSPSQSQSPNTQLLPWSSMASDQEQSATRPRCPRRRRIYPHWPSMTSGREQSPSHLRRPHRRLPSRHPAPSSPSSPSPTGTATATRSSDYSSSKPTTP